MAKYLKHDGNGGFAEANPLDSSAGSSDAGELVKLDATGKLNANLLPTGIGADTASIPASESLSAGDMVNLWDDGGSIKCRKADATTIGKEANGFVLDSVVSGADAEIYFGGTNNQLTGMTPASYQYLDTTAGEITETAPTVAGQVVQVVGKAYSATEMTFEAMMPILLA